MKKTIAILLFLITTLPAHAVVIYTDSAAFNSALPGLTVDDFESYATSGTTSSGGLTAMTFNDFSVTTSPDAAKVLDQTFAFSQNTTPSGANYLYLDTDAGNVGSLSTFTFDSSIAALGFYYTYNPSWDASSSLSLSIGSDSYTLGPVDPNGIGFFGISNDFAFSSFQIDSGIISGYGIDDLAYGGGVVSVPEPVTLGLMGLGLFGLGFAGRKKAA